MKIIFMGTPQFAVFSLLSIINSKKHDILAVVCQPDKPNKRGGGVSFGAVKTCALENNIPILQPLSAKDPAFIEEIRALAPDVLVVVAYGQILPEELLKLPTFGGINVHGSLLPKYRGAAPIQWAIINGEDHTGVTIMRMIKRLDAGDMILKTPVSIDMEDTYGTLALKLAQVGAENLLEVLDDIENDRAKTIMQNDSEATYAHIITKELCRIDWKNDGKKIVNLIRGLNPAPGAYSTINGVKIKIWEAQIFDIACEKSDFGEVIGVIPKEGIVVNANGESLLITHLQKEGGKMLHAADFLRGNTIEKGMKFI